MKKDPLLEKVHKNARTGLYTVPKIKKQSSDKRFCEELKIEEKAYKNLYTEAEKLNGGEALQIGTFAKLRSSAMIGICGDDTSKQAQMLILGSTMGIVDVTRTLKQNPNAPQKSKTLANDFLSLQERNIEILRQYL